MPKYDVVGLGACGVDLRVKLPKLPEHNHKVTARAMEVSEGGVTANNLTQCAKLGLKTAWTGGLGDDEWAPRLLTRFKEDGVAAHPMKFEDTPTQQFWIATDPQGAWSMIGIPAATRKLTAAVVRAEFAEVISGARHFHTEVAVTPLGAALEGAKIAKAAGAKVLVDVDDDPYYLIQHENIGTRTELHRLLRLADVMKLSLTGALGIARRKESARKILRKLLEFGPKLVVITAADKGCYLAAKDETAYCPGVKAKAVDTVGAGDAFMGGLSYALLRGWPLERAGRFANACGALKCSRFGTRASGTLGEVEKLLRKI